MSPTIGIVAASRRRAAPASGIPTTGLLAAYSVRRVVPGYAGALIRVRRSTDNTESDIGFTTGGDLDIAALAAFLGAGTGFVTRWYDQSANAKHATQTTAARQPVIRAADVNGRPGLGFQDAGAVKGLTLPAGLGTIQTWFFTAQWDYPTIAAGIAAGVVLATFGYSGLWSRTSQDGALLYGPTNGWRSPWWTTTYNDGVPRINSYSLPSDISIPHVYTFVSNTGADASGSHLGSHQLGANLSWEGEIAEVVFYDNVLATTGRQAVESSSMSYYGI